MVKPLKYDSDLSLGEAGDRLKEVKEAFEAVKNNYPVSSGKSRNMSEKDKKVLGDCTGVLLPLTHEKSVQEEIRQSGVTEETVFYRAGKLQEEILLYSSRFKNTGVKRIG